MENQHTLEITIDTMSHCLMVKMVGHANIENSDAMHRELDEVASRKDRNILINCSGLAFVSSSGLRAFLKFAKEISDSGKKLGFFSLTNEVAKVFDISGLSQVFAIYKDEAEALCSL